MGPARTCIGMIAARFVFPALLLLPPLTACEQQAFDGTGREQSGSGAGKQATQQARADLQSATIGPLRYEYDHRALTLIEMPIMFPIGPQQQAWGSKLVPAARADQLGQPGCVYGDPPRRRTCNARDEGGLVLALLERPIDDYREGFVRAGLGTQLMPAQLDGAAGFAYNRTRLGTHALYRFIPVGERTLMLAEQELAIEDPAAQVAIAATIRSLAQAVPPPKRPNPAR